MITYLYHMKAKWLDCSLPQAIDVPQLLDKENIDFQEINHVNWAVDYPYKPLVRFRIACCKDGFLLHYKVEEKAVRAHYGEDNGDVWTDSCVEFFSIPGNDGVYYNLECNCIGTILLGVGSGKQGRQRASQAILDTIGRWSSLGCLPFETRMGETSWQVALTIPYRAFFQHDVQMRPGTRFLANFYKCGDNLPTPHFLSWSPIDLPKPNFHCPEFFREVVLE